ncbi:MAG: transglutaminase domain-containing protein [Chitinophagales bacterium]
MLFTCLVASNNVFAQEIQTASKPDWVKDIVVPYEKIDSLGYPDYSNDVIGINIYQEIQINVDSQELFNKLVNKVPPKRTTNYQKVELEHSSKDVDRKVIEVSINKGNQEVNITKNLNWNEQVSNEYVFSKLWESQKTISLSIDKVAEGDIYSVSFLDKLLRDDYKIDESILYSLRDSVQLYFRVISKKPLHYKIFNGFPEVTVIEHDSYFEYIAEGFAVTPYKGQVPSDFISLPFVCFSKYTEFQDIVKSFKDQFIADSKSLEILDDLYHRLTENEPNDSSKIRNIVNYVQDTLVYQDYGLIRSYQPYWCIQGNRGDCKAKSLITIELLKRAEIDSHPVLVRSPRYFEQLDSIPSMYNFNHVIVQFVFEGDTILLDPTSSKQGDKIGAYPIEEFRKGLVIYNDNIEWKEIPAKNKGKIEIYDDISNVVSRKVVLSGEMIKKCQNLKKYYNSSKSLFNDIFSAIDEDSYIIHKMEKPFDKEVKYTDLKEIHYNSTSQDSMVYTQKMYYLKSVNRPLIQIYKSHSQSFGFSNSTPRDSLYKGLWPLNYVNQSIEATYHKDKIPLAEVDFDGFDTNFSLECEFGYYRCAIQENDSLITAKQEIFVSGELPLDRLSEYEEFKEKIQRHIEKARNLILAKKPMQTDKTNTVQAKKRKKRK